MLDKEEIKKNFSRSAPHYEDHAVLQKELADALFFTVGKYHPESILDLGCGTGYLAAKIARHFPFAKVTGIDLAPGMIVVARERYRRGNLLFIEADAEEKTFPAETFDLIVSNASLQWMDFEKVADGVAKMLKLGGFFAFNTFGPQTLNELKEFGFKVNNFLSLEEIKLIMRGDFINKEFASMMIRKEFKDVREMIYHLREIGAQAVDAAGESRIKISKMRKLGPGLMATFEIIFGFSSRRKKG